MYLLDTNHCSHLIDGHPEITARLTSLGDVEVATCVIVRGELRLMVERSERRDENHHKVQAFLTDITIYPIDGAGIAGTDYEIDRGSRHLVSGWCPGR